MDVDRFKLYNDANGHLLGSQTLKELGHILEKNLRKNDIIARYGGDEFVVLLPHTPLDTAAEIAERIRQRIEEHPFPGEDSQPAGTLTVSIGVSSFPYSARTGDDLLKMADAAMYRGKKRGRNKVGVYRKGRKGPPPKGKSPYSTTTL